MPGSQDMTASGGEEPLGAVSCVPAGGAPVYDTPRLLIMRKRADFVAANNGLRVARGGVVLLVKPNAAADLRFGVTVTKRIGNAVVRNRMKRRLRALVRDVLPRHGLAGHDHVLIGRESGVERDFATMRAELLVALERARAGKGDPPRKPRSAKPRR